MSGTGLLFGELAIPTATQCFWLASPLLAFLTTRWLLREFGKWIDARAKRWELGKELGWLNLRAHRRADAILRGLGACIYALLAVTLLGIVWSTDGLVSLLQSTDPAQNFEGWTKLPVLLFCIGCWSLYLGFSLMPKLRDEFEKEELERYRLEHPTSLAEAQDESRLSPNKITVWNSTLLPKASPSTSPPRG